MSSLPNEPATVSLGNRPNRNLDHRTSTTDVIVVAPQQQVLSHPRNVTHELHLGPVPEPSVVSKPKPSIVNPAPLGLCGFALTTFVLSCHNAGIYDSSRMTLGAAFFYGGLIQMLAGMWDFVVGGTYGAVVFSSYGGFWLSWAFSVFMNPHPELGGTVSGNTGAGIFSLAWAIFSTVAFIASTVTYISLSLLILLVDVVFICLTVEHFTEVKGWQTAGGVVGIIAALLAWYNALALFLAAMDHPLHLPVGHIRPLVQRYQDYQEKKRRQREEAEKDQE